MKSIFQTVLVLLLLTMFVACPIVIDDNPPPPLMTPVGTNVGSPVTQTISATGGTITMGTIKVSAPAGAFSSANLTLQPITDTLNGSGQGIAISSDATWNKYLTVTFPIEPSDQSPDGLGLAVQQPNGSWLAIEPVKVDKVAGTISAGLPAVTSRSRSGSSLSARAGLVLTRVVQFRAFYLKPSRATLKVKESLTFVPYARVVEKRPILCPPRPGDDELANLNCWREVTNEYPFTNEKAGFNRQWFVDNIFGGNPIIGTITPKSPSGAMYTAPDTQPSPDTVVVEFISINEETSASVTLRANVKIVGAGYKVVADFTSMGYPACLGFIGIADLSDHVEFVLTPTSFSKFKAQEIQNQTSQGNDTFRPAPGLPVTRNSPTEVQTMTEGSAEQGSGGVDVSTVGKSTIGSCTLNIKPPQTYPEGTDDTVYRFTFDPNGFVNNTQKVSVAEAFGKWEYTISPK